HRAGGRRDRRGSRRGRRATRRRRPRPPGPRGGGPGRPARRRCMSGAAAPWSWPERIALREVGPRDGLQGEPPLSVDDRVALIRALADAGVTAIEVGAFVSPRAVPAMARTAEVIARSGPLPGVRRTVLVPNP